MTFVPVRKEILTKQDLDVFHTSEAHSLYVDWILALNDAVRDKKNSCDVFVSERVRALTEMLSRMDDWVTKVETVDNAKSRFGNPAFRTWLEKMKGDVESLLSFVPKDAVVEVGGYLLVSFGDEQRIDYGTGHEANFMAFLLCLHRLGLIVEEDFSAIVLHVFNQYISLMRNLQVKYWLEPAGSHGVWGLDDYHFLPFLFGSSQLYNHPHIKPKSIHNEDILEAFGDDYMYLKCIKFVNSVKTESLRWHSPMLDDISGVKTWTKVNEGMIKMYKAEVLGKLPIMQHFLFGSLIQFHGSANEQEQCNEHVHAMGQEFPTCCGMRIPSAAAGQAARGEQERNGTRIVETGYLKRVKPLPFD
jgi:serine/threonine-protein phosphatase 2A activator